MIKEGSPLSDAIIVALLGLLGTLAGSFLGVIASQRLTQYRLERLEKKVDLHNSVIERTFILEGEMREAQHDIRDLKAYHKPQ